MKHPTEPTFLILKRSATERIRPSTWDLPSGHVLYGERHDDALRREIKEETNLEVGGVQAIQVKTRYDEKQPMYYILIALVCQAASDRVMLSNEHSDYQWITKDAFLSLDPKYAFKEERSLDTSTTDFLCDIVSVAFSKKQITLSHHTCKLFHSMRYFFDSYLTQWPSAFSLSSTGERASQAN